MILISDVLKYREEEYEKFTSRYKKYHLSLKEPTCKIYGHLKDTRFSRFPASVIMIYQEAAADGSCQFLVSVEISVNLKFTCICDADEFEIVKPPIIG